jgi:glycosyltransferase involved in cell wall biosynthesis
MINVLHLRDTDRICGPGKTIIETALATDRRSFTQKVGLFVRSAEERNPFCDAASARGVEVIPVMARHRFDLRVIREINRIIDKHDIHLVHSHEYKSDILAFLASRIRPIPIITTIHGWITNHLKSRVYVGLERRILPRFDRVVAVSAETRRRVLECGVPEARVDILHNAIVTKHYQSDGRQSGYFYTHHGVPQDAVIVGYVGRLSPEKGQRDLLAAAASLVDRHARLHVALVGDGPDRESLGRIAIELGLGARVILTGHIADVRPIYRDLDIVALTSHTEGFPNIVLEALCMEKPVVATSVGGVPEIIEDGVTGLLVPPGSPRAIANALERLLVDRSVGRALAAEGKRVVHDRFQFADRVAREEEIYREVLDRWQR